MRPRCSFIHSHIFASALARASAASACLLLTSALQGCDTNTLSPDMPQAIPVTHATPALPELDVSVVDAPIRYALSPLLSALEGAVPRRFGNLEKRIDVKGHDRTQVAFEAIRRPFSVDVRDGKLILETTVSYEARGWYRPLLGPAISAGCGDSKDRDGRATAPQPRVRIVLSSDINLTPDWKLASRTRVRAVEPLTRTERDICRVTFLGIDVTDHIARAVMPQINSRMPTVDRTVARIDVRSRAAGWFAALQRNIRVADSLWLQLRPERISVGELSLEDSTLVADIRMWARPMMVSGPEPRQVITGLPRLNTAQGEVGDSARLFMDGLLDYDDATAMMQRELAHRRFFRFGRSVVIDSIRLYPLGDGRVVLATTVSGAVRGTAYLVGTPTIDHQQRALVVPDLDFDVATSNALVAGLAWLRKGELVQMLRASARFPLDSALEETRRRVEGALNRELTSGVRLTGAVMTGKLVDVLVYPQWLVVRAEAAGRLALDIDRPVRGGVGRGSSGR